MGAVKNMVRGVIFSAVYVLTTIVVPLVTFTLIFSIEGLPFQWEQQDYQNITFWITAFGLLISGLAFFTFSSPKHSIRRGVFALIQVIVNCLYLWSYKFSGAAEISFIIVNFGFFTLNVQQMLSMYMGIYFLTIVLKLYDVIDFTINREKIREKRMKK
ncbi:hypothetical protein LCGC14_0566600 [marine sediment metagenome]|uniref:Uncharacterized protein n=1 Tax=marine sediment metagenome TaxID=412755 RepID=A0A0F9RQN6_9ZZZZ|nr:MAG: hypothetical protein Lokiarch_08100 [Candidatus Lokiarchaeum sp. GC14_75]